MTGSGVPTRAEVDALPDADGHTLGQVDRSRWVLVWTGGRWRLMFDPPSAR